MGANDIIDIEVFSDQDTRLDETGDLPLITGVPNIKQSLALDVLNETESRIAQRITNSTVNGLQGDIQTALQNDPQVDTIESIEVLSTNEQTNEIEIGVTVNGDVTFPATIDVVEGTINTE